MPFSAAFWWVDLPFVVGPPAGPPGPPSRSTQGGPRSTTSAHSAGASASISVMSGAAGSILVTVQELAPWTVFALMAQPLQTRPLIRPR